MTLPQITKQQYNAVMSQQPRTRAKLLNLFSDVEEQRAKRWAGMPPSLIKHLNSIQESIRIGLLENAMPRPANYNLLTIWAESREDAETKIMVLRWMADNPGNGLPEVVRHAFKNDLKNAADGLPTAENAYPCRFRLFSLRDEDE